MVMSVCLIQVSPNKSKAFIFLTKIFKLLLIPLSNLSQISFNSPSDKQNIALEDGISGLWACLSIPSSPNELSPRTPNSQLDN